MIPLRIALEGFLSCRERQELDFAGSALWMLAGPNGSGKSSIFDALTYTLFGRHRGGHQNARDLINKGCERLEVEFDFSLDGEVYQARRTLKRESNRATRQLRRRVGDGWEAVPGTSSESGFDAWLREHLGLNYETFTSSVLLLQGRAEKLLDADPRERRRILADLVGLERYQKLHARADERRKQLQAEERVLQADLERLPKVSAEALDEAQTRLDASEQALAAAVVEVNALYQETLSASEAPEAVEVRRQLAESEAAALKAREEVSAAAALHRAAQERRHALEGLSGATTCNLCGQDLSVGHLLLERQRLERTRAETEARHLQALEVQRAADAAVRWLQTKAVDEQRRLRDRLQERMQAARRRQEECSRAAASAAKALERLHEQQARHDEVEERLRTVTQQHHRQQLLAELLGPKRLQRELVRRAERGIVLAANAILDRLSSGYLYLRLRGESDGADESALELEACDRRATGPSSVDVRLLSGSQRFRVAVSLALGVGQYVGRQHRPIETVIIDEGFGCLDRDGRQAMIQELQNLRGQLKCILLVSHQEEFAEAFGDGYHFELRDGATRVTRFQR